MKTVKNNYEAPMCEECLIAVESTILDGSGNIGNVTTEGFGTPTDDNDGWL